MKPWGCFNKTADSGHWVQDGWLKTSNGQPYQAKFVWVAYTMSLECRYDKRKIDERCEGCKR